MLELLVQAVNPLVYKTCAANWVPYPPGALTGYHGWCGTSPHQAFESIVLLDSFVYDHAADRYRFVCWMNQANWPSWSINSFIIHPETGVIESRQDLVGYAVAHAWTEPIYNGGLNKVYAGYLVTASGYGIVEVGLPDGIPSSAQVANPILTALQVPILAATNNGFAVSPENKLICVLSLTEGLTVYDYSTTPGTRLYYHPFNESFGWGMGYENEENCWCLFSSAQLGSGASIQDRQTLVKYNYRRDKIELVSELQQQGAPDRFAQVAFDTKRKKLAAIRIKADDPVTGAASNTFEIYSPRPAMAHVTVPVAIKQISEDTETTFISHLLGTKAEAGGGKEVVISCSPTAALIKNPKQVTEVNGRVAFNVTPPTLAATETITVAYTETKVT